MPAWEDLDDFLDTDEFAVQVVAGVHSFSGIFNDPFRSVDFGDYSAETTSPTLTCKSIDVAGLKRGDTLIIDGAGYDLLSGPQGDGTGISVIELAPRDGSDDQL